MSTRLEINLLGVPRFSQGGRALECSSRKAVWLVAHVLLRRTQVERHELARLLWADAELPKALGSLRVALTRLPREVLDCVEVHRHYIGPARDAQPRLDVDEFAALCRAEDVPSLLRATRLYTGDLIDEPDASTAPEFFDWVSVERGRLREMAHAAHVSCAEKLRAGGNRAAAMELANAWLARDPADEAMNRLLMAWLAIDAGNDRALAQFDAYRRALAVARGATPSPMMVALAERLQHRGAAVPVPDARLAAGTALIGRETDMAQLAERLRDPGCRLLTLLGMGGLGKTRLALALAEAAGNLFEDGVYVAGLADVATPALFAQTVARACGLQPTGAGMPIELLITFFRRRQALLVLDNLEHLLATDASVAADIAALLAGTGARFKLLTTSREPVRLQEEWLYPLEGLAHPPRADEASRRAMADADAQATTLTDQQCAAVQLFISRARQTNHRFTPDTRSREVAEICALLEGLPLGIELAAGWVGEVEMPALLQALQTESARLASAQLNRPARQRSLGAVVAYSWERLTAESKQVLAGLAVLSGTFSSEAAGRIASATQSNLQALAGRSLLIAREDGRWHIHEVVRQFAWDVCGEQPARQEAVRLRRDQFYLGWLRDQAMHLQGTDEAAAMRDIDNEAANVRLAWQSRAAVASADSLAALSAAAPVWFEYLECRCFYAEGIAAAEAWLALARAAGGKADTAAPLFMLGLFQRFAARAALALTTLDAAIAVCVASEADASTAGQPALQEMHARALAARAFTHLLLGDPPRAEQDIEASLAMTQTLPRQLSEATRLGLQASACRVLGLVLLQTGRREVGRARQQEALQLALQTGRPSLLAAAYNNLALAENHLGNTDAAEAGYQNALAAWRGLQATVNIGRSLHNLGVVATRKGEHALALERYRTALETLRRVDDRNLIALNLMSTGDALLRLGRPVEAMEPASQALEMAERDGHALPALDARIVLAQAAIACSEYSQALRHLLAAIETPGMRKFSNVCADVVVTAARLVQDLRTPKPMPPGLALRWAGAIERMENVSLSIRKDAADFLAAHPQPSTRRVAHTAATLDSLCDEVQTTLQDIAGQFA